MDLNLLWIIQLAPLAAFLSIMMLPKTLKRYAPALGAFFSFVAAFAAINLLLAHPHGHELPLQYNFEWLNIAENPLWPNIKISDYVLNVGFLADQVNILMITLVTTISVCVQLFSYYYMQNDPSRARYFAFLSFFSFAMTGLVLSNNLLQTFMFWELVGLASYLLIGFWFEKKSAGDAARKAFVINRLADLGFYAGIILLVIHLGSVNFLDFSVADLHLKFSSPMITLLGILVFTGVMENQLSFRFMCGCLMPWKVPHRSAH